MGQIFGQVGQAFVQAIPTVIFLAALVFILKRIFFRPLSDVLKKREEQTKGALVQARDRAALAGKKAEDYEAAWQKVRQEVYGLREADRRAALAAREEVIRQARERGETLVRDARTSLAAQGEATRRELAPATQGLADEIVGSILAPPGAGSAPLSGAREGAS